MNKNYFLTERRKNLYLIIIVLLEHCCIPTVSQSYGMDKENCGIQVKDTNPNLHSTPQQTTLNRWKAFKARFQDRTFITDIS